jgi:hypothetical protein
MKPFLAVTFLAVVAMLLSAPQMSFAQEKEKEHPEEHPEHPEDAAAMTVEGLAEAITAYIENDSKLKGGYFLVFDGVDKKALQLKLVKVHQDKLASLGDSVYFACTDMKASDGTVYDVDFFMKDSGHGIMTTEVSIHKKSGKARYGWKESDGIWSKVKN